MFIDRYDAGTQLALLLSDYKIPDAIVYALPRGGVVIGYEIAQRLGIPLELVITRKIGHPQCPEYAIGIVSETGKYIINEKEEFIDKRWLEKEIRKEQGEAIRRQKTYCTGHQEITGKGKTAIIVDDGVATGLSLSLAVNVVKAKEPKEIVVAVPVISQEIANSISNISDRLVALEIIKDTFGSVSEYYENFDQLSDERVMKLLSKIWKMKLLSLTGLFRLILFLHFVAR